MEKVQSLSFITSKKKRNFLKEAIENIQECLGLFKKDNAVNEF